MRFIGGGSWRDRFTGLTSGQYLDTGYAVLVAITEEMERWPSGFLGGLVTEEPAVRQAS